MKPNAVRRVAPLAVAALVLAVIASVWVVLRIVDPPGSGGSGSGSSGSSGSGDSAVGSGDAGADPAPLRLIGWPGAAGELRDPRFVVAAGVTLPAGPGTAPVYVIDPADAAAAVERRGAALDVAAPPAAGWVARAGTGVDYPLLTAGKAFELLAAAPQPAVACPDMIDGGPVDQVPACGGQVTATGATLGSTVALTDTGPLLMPAWVFEIDRSARPLVQMAIDPRFLAPAQEVPGSSGSGSTGGSTGGSGGEPSGGSATTTGGRITSATRAGDDRSVDVTFWGGVADCYSYDVVTEESPRRVGLTVVERRKEGADVCIEVAVEVTKTVPLAEPLGLRLLVDAASGEVLLGPRR